MIIIKEECKTLYEDGWSLSKLATKYKVSPNTIKKWLIEQNVALREKIDYLEMAPLWKELYETEELSLTALSKVTGVRRHTISKYLKKLGVHVKSAKEQSQKHTLNESYFEKIDSKIKAFWLGLIAADANVHKRKFEITLKHSDRHLLEKLAFFLGSSHPIKERNVKGKPYSRFQFTNATFCKNLKKHGIVENKTFHLEFPDFINNEEFLRYYILGYLAGDGGILSGYYESPRIFFIGRMVFLEKLQQFISQKVPGLLGVLSPDKRNENTFSLTYSGNIQVLALHNWLYRDGDEFYLERKKYDSSQIKKPRMSAFGLFCCPICDNEFERLVCQTHLGRKSKSNITCCNKSCSMMLRNQISLLSEDELKEMQRNNVINIFEKQTYGLA